MKHLLIITIFSGLLMVSCKKENGSESVNSEEITEEQAIETQEKVEVEAKLTAETPHFKFKCDAEKQSKEYVDGTGSYSYTYPLANGIGIIEVMVKETDETDAKETIDKIVAGEDYNYQEADFMGYNAYIEDFENPKSKLVTKSIVFYNGKKLYTFTIMAKNKENLEDIYNKFSNSLELF